MPLLAVVENVAVWPASTVAFDGVEVESAALTVSTLKVAARLVTLEMALVNTASNSKPSFIDEAMTEKVLAVAPGMTDHDAPWSPDSLQTTEGVGLPLAVALNVARVPMTTLTSEGCEEILGALAGATMYLPAISRREAAVARPMMTNLPPTLR